MPSRTGHIVVRSVSACAALSLAWLFAAGCAAPVLEYEDQFTQARIDNPDGDNLWDQADRNGNGTIDEDETYSPTVAFQSSSATLDSRPQIPNNTPPTLSIPSVEFGSSSAVAGFSGFSTVNVAFDAPVGSQNSSIALPPLDFDDLIFFVPTFNEMNLKSLAQMRGVQVVRALRFSNHRENSGNPEVEHQFEISTGARYFRLKDDLSFNASGGFIGDVATNTSMDNACVGPQLGAKWYSRSDKWSIDATGDILVGYHNFDGQQLGQLGQELVPGALNRPFNSAPTYISNQQNYNQFSPLGEFDASASYQLSGLVTLRLGYNVFYAGNLRYAEESIQWTLPDMGISDVPGRDEFRKTVYANLEILR